MRQVDLLDLHAVALARGLLVEPALPIRRQLLPSARVVARVPLSKLAHRHEAQSRRAAAARRAHPTRRGAHLASHQHGPNPNPNPNP